MKIEVMQIGVDFKNGVYHKIAFTGHRPNKLGGYAAGRNCAERVMIKNRLYDACSYMITHCGTTEFMEGMAQGVDQDAGSVILQIIVESRIEGNGTPACVLHAAVPYPGQEEVWPKEAQRHYHNQLDCIEDQDYYISDGHKEEYIHYVHDKKPRNMGEAAEWLGERNHYMVDWCDLLIGVWDGTPGGTKNCIDYAKKVGKPIVLLRLVW